MLDYNSTHARSFQPPFPEVMKSRILLSWAWICLSAVLETGMTCAQVFPAKPIRIVTAEPAGGLDLAARLMAQGLAGNLGQQILVENRGGAGGTIAAQTIAKAPPDGYALLFYGSAIWLAPFLRDNVPFDPVRDFAPVTLAVSSPNLLVVHPLLPVKSVRELIALAKARHGELNYAANSMGSSPHLAAELFKAMAGISMIAVSYKGGGHALNDLIGGQVQLMFATPASVASLVKVGKLRALAVTSAQSTPLLPGMPTVAATGLPGYKSGATYIVFAPAGTPATLISRLQQEFARVLGTREVKEKFFEVGVEPVGSSPDEAAALVRSDMDSMGKVIKSAGIRTQ